MFSRSVSSCVSPAIGLTTIVRSFSPQFGLPTEICESGIVQSEGASLFRALAPSVRFIEDLVRLPDHNSLSLQNCPEPRAEPALSVRSRHHLRCKSFLVPPVRSQFPDCFPEFRCRFSKEFPLLVPLRVPVLVVPMALVCSLLLEDCSSVDS